MPKSHSGRPKTGYGRRLRRRAEGRLWALSVQRTTKVKMEVKRFHDRINASTDTHPVDFDDVWTLAGYSRKDSAKRAGEIILHTSVEVSPEDCVNKIPPKRGPAPETILMTVRGFKHFCLMAPGKRGAQMAR